MSSVAAGQSGWIGLDAEGGAQFSKELELRLDRTVLQERTRLHVLNSDDMLDVIQERCRADFARLAVFADPELDGEYWADRAQDLTMIEGYAEFLQSRRDARIALVTYRGMQDALPLDQKQMAGQRLDLHGECKPRRPLPLTKTTLSKMQILRKQIDLLGAALRSREAIDSSSMDFDGWNRALICRHALQEQINQKRHLLDRIEQGIVG